MKSTITFILAILFLPILVVVDIIRSERAAARKLGYILLTLLLIGFTWITGYSNLEKAGASILYDVGITDKIINIPVSGTSMLPTIQDESTITLHSPKKYGLERGDIVSFENIETTNRHFLKRIVGLGGEKISLVNGVVLINAQELEENYVYRNEPTLGNTFLTPCETYAIPKGKVVVMGDNRLVSMDSRIIGFIDVNDIDGVIKTHIGSSMKSIINQPNIAEKHVNSEEFLKELNKRREEKKRNLLRLHPALNQIAQQRSDLIVSSFDNWKSQSKPLRELLEKRGYQYLLLEEYVTYGYLNEKQLVEQIMESPVYQDEFLSDRYYEIGIGISQMQKGKCTFPVVSILLSWPSNPDYTSDDISIWKREIDTLSRMTTALQSLQYQQNVNQLEVKNLIEEINDLLKTATLISSKVEKNEWLTQSESKLLNDYDQKMQDTIKKLIAFYNVNQEHISDPAVKKLFIDILPGNPEFNKLSEDTKLLFGQGKYNEQLESAQKLIQIAQNDKEQAIGYYWLGLAQYKLEKDSESKSNLLKAIQLDPTYAAPYVTLTAHSLNEQNYNQALTYALRCVELDPNYGWCHNDLGLTYLYLGQKQKAIAEFEKAVSLDPNSYVFNDNLKRARGN